MSPTRLVNILLLKVKPSHFFPLVPHFPLHLRLCSFATIQLDWNQSHIWQQEGAFTQRSGLRQGRVVISVAGFQHLVKHAGCQWLATVAGSRRSWGSGESSYWVTLSWCGRTWHASYCNILVRKRFTLVSWQVHYWLFSHFKVAAFFFSLLWSRLQNILCDYSKLYSCYKSLTRFGTSQNICFYSFLSTSNELCCVYVCVWLGLGGQSA